MAGLFGGGAAATGTSSTQGDTSKDIDIAQASLPSDSISDIAWSPTHDYLAVASWDTEVRIYEAANGTMQGKWSFKMKGPVLGVTWSSDGKLVAASCAGQPGVAAICDLSAQNPNGQTNCPIQQVAQHEDTIKCVRFCKIGGNEFLATGSWDKTVKFWNLKSDQPDGTIQCEERVYTMDVKNALLVIGTAERHILMVNLADPTKIYKKITSPLKWQTRVVSCFTDATGFAVGSIEGRCAIQYVEDSQTPLNFSFKCHRQQDTAQRDTAKVYSVNAISFHPIHGTFSTAGSDGTFHFWDKDAKHRLKGYPEVGGSITATAFNRNGDAFAYAVSYDWSKGYAFNTPQQPIKLKVHMIQPDECKPRPGSKKR